MDWSLQFYYDKNFDHVFINKFFYFLVSRGVKYIGGYYSILTKDTTKGIEHSEKEVKESTEKLAEIIDTYLKFDLRTTHFSIFLNYLGEVDFGFSIYFIPVNGNKCLISFEVGEHLIPDEKTFLAFINLCKDVFDRLNLIYGVFRSEYQGYIPSSEEDFLKILPDIVNFYSRPLVDKIGGKKLLSAPARKVEVLENGGIMLLACTEQLGCPDELDRVRLHLGYNLRHT